MIHNPKSSAPQRRASAVPVAGGPGSSVDPTSSGAASPLVAPSTLDRDANLALAFLIQNQNQWKPRIVAASQMSHTRSNVPFPLGTAVELPLTLVGVVR